MLVDPYIIHVHHLWENAGLIGFAGPGAADSHIDDQIKVLVEGRGKGGLLRRCKPVSCRVEKLVVHIPADFVGFLFERKDVKIVGEAYFCRQIITV
jgi:hypothetical protein